ncbi:hypothetical protein [Treponema sp.]|uniref:hypothetical protein n=1 Tax=Treponema sp. TaxID=166 RepID=UPI002A8303C5|nr:hypothetical protein [Treponema sp.]MDD7269759.1 hypothetical protein [Treponema sp.]MDY4131619.1 hypothetical protein [Treponema sp.]
MLNQPERKPDYFIQIPPEVLFETKLSAGAKLFYGEVLFLTYTYGFCSQKNAYFAANHRVSLRTVENWIKELKALNLIKVELIRKQNKEVELRKIFALAKIDFSKMPSLNQISVQAEASPPARITKPSQKQKKPYGASQNVFLSDNEMGELLKNHTKEQTEKAIELYSEWKEDKGANPRSDFNSMQWALREIEKPAPITKSGRRLTAVQESGCDEVSEETLANLPF